MNLFFVFEADIVPDIRFIGSHAGASRWEKLFWRYPEIAGRYIEFLESRIPPGATVFLPPKGWPFYFTRNTTFMQYFLPGRKLVSADDFDVAGDFVAWARRKGITHIAMPRGVSRYGAGRHLVEGGTEERKRTAAYIQRLEETALPAVYMEEKVTTRLRDLKIRLNDGNVLLILDEASRGDGVRPVRSSLSKKGLDTQLGEQVDMGSFTLSAEYSSSDGRVNPEDLWGVPVDLPAEDVESIGAEIWSSTPSSACVFAVFSGDGVESQVRSDFNAAESVWEKAEIEGLSAPKVRGRRLKCVGLCIRPLGWGYLEVSD